jgi:hypothetical protein
MHLERFFVPGLAHASYLLASGDEAVLTRTSWQRRFLADRPALVHLGPAEFNVSKQQATREELASPLFGHTRFHKTNLKTNKSKMSDISSTV